MIQSYMLQLHTGSFLKASYTSKEILEKLEHILQKIKVSSVILGWCTDYRINMDVVSYLHDHQIACYLWYPVLSEMDAVADSKEAVSFTGEVVSPLSLQDETFSFLCPNSYENYHNAIEVYERYFSMIPFDGIFLDKIRFSSFANGYAEGFGCFCKACEFFYEQKGIDLKQLKVKLSNKDGSLAEGEYGAHGTYLFHDDQVQKFYQLRARLISDYVFRLAAYFNSRKKIVGLDIFAPFFAYHCGQDIMELSKMADFIKPMFYTHTHAPAGMQYEYDAYISYMTHASFQKQWKHNPCSTESLKQQFSFLEGIQAQVCPGMEINNIQDICDITKEDVLDMKNLFQDAGFQRIVLSWDIMHMDDEILNIL